MSPLAKVPLLFIATYLHQLAATSPNPAPGRNEEAKFENAEGKLRKAAIKLLGPLIFEGFTWFTTICESAVILSRAYPSRPSSRILTMLTSLFGTTIHTTSLIRVSPQFILGWTLAVSGVLIRIACYRHLGRFFTFELAVRKDHYLVTSGPYAYVRHPSYTGTIMLFIGTAMTTLGGGAWLAECSTVWSSPSGRIFLLLLFGLWITLAAQVISRTGKEDAILKKEFGKQWDDWAQKTPYRLCPGIY